MTIKTQQYQAPTGRILREDSTFLNRADWLDESRNSDLAFRVVPGPSVSDQAGRTRISEPVPLGDYKLLYSRLPQFFDTVTNGTGAVGYNESHKAHEMETAADGDWAIVQTYQRHNYFAGKSQFVEFTTFNFENQVNIEKRIGYYSSGTATPYQTNIDGFYIYTDGTKHYLRIVNNGVEIANIAQEDWDDPLDGTGLSGFTIDWETFNVFQVSFLWLGGAGLRLSIITDGSIHQVHAYDHIGGENSDKLIFSSPNQPLRFELLQTGPGTGLFQPVCMTVATEGSEASGSIGEVFSVNSGITNNVTLSHPERGVVKGYRLRSNCLFSVVDVLSADSFASTTNDFFRWELVMNPTLQDGDDAPKALTFTDVTESPIQEATGDGNTFAVGGDVIASGYGAARSYVSKFVASARGVGAAIDGTPDELYLVVTPLQGTTNINVFGSITVKVFI